MSSLFLKEPDAKSAPTRDSGDERVFYELLMVNDDIRELILEKAPSNVIKDKGRSYGMKTLREAGWSKVRDGVSTVSEVLRVTQVE